MNQKRAIIANRVEAYWRQVERQTERDLAKVVKKFRLKFATLVTVSEQNEMGLDVYHARREWADFYFYV